MLSGGVRVRVNSVAVGITLPSMVSVFENLLDRIGAVPPILDIIEDASCEDVAELNGVLDSLSLSDDVLEVLVSLFDSVVFDPSVDCIMDVAEMLLDCEVKSVALDEVVPSIDNVDSAWAVELIIEEVTVPGRIVIAMGVTLSLFISPPRIKLRPNQIRTIDPGTNQAK